ncbi:MAG: GTPase ObgE [Actinobacteria bacterium]|nr:GTPase ObgE [Actinomycetota bacterium]
MSGFVDEAQVHLRAGDGGAGAVSFRREAHEARGGPDGGDGGKGGDVWLVAGDQRSSLAAFRDHPYQRAADGKRGGGKSKRGADGEDLYVAVPVGTVVKDRTGSIVCDLANPGDRWLGARGGRAGRGNARFLTNSRRAPAFAERAEPGEEYWYNLELKLFADVGVVGFPNSGKSTLVSTVSAAKPKIADYPFTTLEPHLGVVRLTGASPSGDVSMYDEPGFVIADIPGIIAGAAEGKGLGWKFLRHIERAQVLLVLVDVSDSCVPAPSVQLDTILRELRQYDSTMLDRPRLVVGSKVDMAGPASGGMDPRLDMTISSITGVGVSKMLWRLWSMVRDAKEASRAPSGGPVVVHRPVPEGMEVIRDANGAFVVSGRQVVRAVSLNNLEDLDTAMYVANKLDALGVDRALKRAGARDGDIVRIGNMEFVYTSDGDLAVPGRRHR